MTTVEKLLERGYVRYKPSRIDGECVTDLYQKRFDDEGGKKYFITVKRWDLSRFNDALHEYEPSLEYHVQLYAEKTHAALDLTFFKDWEIEAVEAETERIYSTGAYERYEDWETS